MMTCCWNEMRNVVTILDVGVIQFALERGILVYLGVLGTKRLPYPSKSFKLAHCSHCRIDWLRRDGLLLLKLDRLLRPKGYFAYSSPEAYARDEEDLRIWKEMSALVERMCCPNCAF
ncbi:probable methyltransferase PMT1 [Olea europaea subsp. europaea]|uniref:Methyltransferase n=1 Tax=Olea europaea subsp. europaea TaxID=158383 RepID=A0A8S0QZ33_OLEEU|nr:probable methyltransferase PMT1 [Olea europaea subsp. europaea]